MVGFISNLAPLLNYLRRRSPGPPFPPDHRQAGERGAIIIVEDIHKLEHSRAYRVFKYYIRKLVNDRCEVGPDASDTERRSISKGIKIMVGEAMI